MVKTIDYYDYWNKKRSKDVFLEDREKIALSIIKKNTPTNSKVLDAGCGNGNFMNHLIELRPDIKVKGLDYSKSEVAEAKKNNLDVKWSDFSRGINAKNNEFDLVYTGEVIEHLFDPDHYLSELNRVIKPGGRLVITTPNLCAWFNRILMPLGIQPLFLEPSTRSKLVGAGILKKLKKESQPVGHVRIFTHKALKDLLEMNGFKIEKSYGAIYQTGLPKSLLYIDRLFKLNPKISSVFVISARKRK